MRAGFGIVALLAVAGTASADCNVDRVDLRGDWGRARFTVELADDPDERSLGLMHRDFLPSGSGMLFAYETPQRAVFWMKNTRIPLDMIFLSPSGRVTRVHENAIPFDETHIDGGEGVKFVLEINGGLSRRLGINEGSELRHPVIGPDPVWPCE
ncbi:MAG: DUF192 domain-containing protein [Boseongicola sp.]|nr:DUF192 domain-containing protein [Boseongicola sp.]